MIFMREELFEYLLWGMSAMALVVFICLYFVKAGYGVFRTREWGWAINNRLAWVVMEAPAFVVMLVMWLMTCATGPSLLSLSTPMPVALFFGMFMLHYFQRSFIFPFLMTGKSKMPVAIMMMGVVFNCINGIMQGGGLFLFAPDAYSEGAAYLLRPNAIIGVIMFLVGMCINWHSDHVIRHLRQPGDTRHYLPAKGMYRFVTSANYFGELVEWTGFAIAAATPAAWVFVWWTAANLVPRAHAIHKHYRQEFGEAVGKRKRVIPFVY